MKNEFDFQDESGSVVNVQVHCSCVFDGSRCVYVVRIMGQVGEFQLHKAYNVRCPDRGSECYDKFKDEFISTYSLHVKMQNVLKSQGFVKVDKIDVIS